MSVRLRTTAAAWMGLALTAASAQAAISVANTAQGLFNPSTAAGAFTIPYQATSPGNVVVVAMYLDGGNGAATSLSFGSGVGDQAPGGLLTQARNSMAYFVNPATSAGLSINGTSGNAGVTNAGYYIWELAGVDLSAPVASVIGTDSATQITTTLASSFIIDSLGFNPFSTPITTTPDANSVLTTSNALDVNSAIGGGWLAYGDATVGVPGTYDLGWDVTVASGFGDLREMAFAFAPTGTQIPEPNTLVLLGLSGVIVAFARRR